MSVDARRVEAASRVLWDSGEVARGSRDPLAERAIAAADEAVGGVVAREEYERLRRELEAEKFTREQDGGAAISYYEEAERLRETADKLAEALDTAADDLDKAANQFAGIKASQEVGHTVAVNVNPTRFAEKAERARQQAAAYRRGAA